MFDKGMMYDTLIGFSCLSISSLLIKAETELDRPFHDWFSVFYQNERVGHLKIQSEFIPYSRPGLQDWEKGIIPIKPKETIS